MTYEHLMHAASCFHWRVYVTQLCKLCARGDVKGEKNTTLSRISCSYTGAWHFCLCFNRDFCAHSPPYSTAYGDTTAHSPAYSTTYHDTTAHNHTCTTTDNHTCGCRSAYSQLRPD